eukprot:GHVN01039336.1.p1 GENE.GHVN01039336.1~~GHVN01039336.1.p1  ORF type:complete len:237 (+),score=51.66 GHVN01039336.1:148-858(+)
MSANDLNHANEVTPPDDGGGWQSGGKKNRRPRPGQRDGERTEETPHSPSSESAARPHGPVTVNSVEEGKQVYRQAVCKVFQDWTPVKLAVQYGWGGRTSASKREQLIEETLIYLETIAGSIRETPSDNQISVLGDLLADELDKKFNTDLEDDSEDAVAATLLSLRYQCSNGNFSLAQKVFNLQGCDAAESVGREILPVNVDGKCESSDPVADPSRLKPIEIGESDEWSDGSSSGRD